MAFALREGEDDEMRSREMMHEVDSLHWRVGFVLEYIAHEVLIAYIKPSPDMIMVEVVMKEGDTTGGRVTRSYHSERVKAKQKHTIAGIR